MKHPRTSLFLTSLTTCLAFAASGSLAQEWVSKPEHLSVEKSEYSHYLEQNFPQHVYFGDTREVELKGIAEKQRVVEVRWRT